VEHLENYLKENLHEEVLSKIVNTKKVETVNDLTDAIIIGMQEEEKIKFKKNMINYVNENGLNITLTPDQIFSLFLTSYIKSKFQYLLKNPVEAEMEQEIKLNNVISDFEEWLYATLFKVLSHQGASIPIQDIIQKLKNILKEYELLS